MRVSEERSSPDARSSFCGPTLRDALIFSLARGGA
jgi:hypothetical protein